MTDRAPAPAHALHRFAQLTAAMTWLLLIAGGLVTSTGSSLAIPDWPLAYGQLIPPLVGGIRFEYGHRVIAGLVGLLTLALAVWLQRREPRREVRRLGWLAVGAVVLQAVLGGVTVRLHLPPAISIAHACLGQTFFGLLVALSLVTAPSWNGRAPVAAAEAAALRRWSGLSLAALYLQLIFGARVRHTGQGLMAHLAWAGVAAMAVLATASLAWRLRAAGAWLARTGAVAVGLLAAQAILGGLLWQRWPALQDRGLAGAAATWLTTLHVGVGAALLAALLVLAMRTGRWLQPTPASRPRAFADYLTLTKPRITGLAALTTWVGYLLGSGGQASGVTLVPLLFGTWLVVGGAGALNQWWERDVDALMERTKRRPLPAGRLQPRSALRFGVGLALIGLAILAVGAHRTTAALAAAALLIYLCLYTPLKRRTSLCTLVGAVPGAVPPLMGWSAAHGTLEVEAWWLFAILFLWQLPHFLAIAWLFREDYARAGFKMLPVIDADGGVTGRQIVVYALALLPVSLAPTLLGLAGGVYFAGALLLGLGFLGMGLWAAVVRSRLSARRLFLTSLAYLPCLLVLMTCNLTASAATSAASTARCCPPPASPP